VITDVPRWIFPVWRFSFSSLGSLTSTQETLVVDHLPGGLDRATFRKKLATTHSLKARSMLFSLGATYLTSKVKGASTMEWVTPQHEEIDLNCEVSSYANAEL
jgi:hypothetical protein